jgi:hypothetical protein
VKDEERTERCYNNMVAGIYQGGCTIIVGEGDRLGGGQEQY